MKDAGRNANPTNDDITLSEAVETNVDNMNKSVKEKLNKIKKENIEMRYKIKDNVQIIEMFRVENEELENKNDVLESEKIPN